MCLTFASKTVLDDLSYEPGGSAANSANVMALLGMRAKLVSAVGGDVFGKLILDDLESRGIGTEYVAVLAGKKSAVGISLLSQGGEKSALVYRGANAMLGPGHLPSAAVKDCGFVFITSQTSARNFALFLRAARLAKSYGKRIVFAPSITMLKRFRKRIRSMHGRFDLCVMNYEEGMYYAGKKELEGILTGMPGKVRVVTKDRDCAFAFDGNKFYHVPSVARKIVDTTGAGDAFTGALAFEFAKAGTIVPALQVATKMAQIKLAHLGPRVDLGREKMRSLMEAAREIRVRRLSL